MNPASLISCLEKLDLILTCWSSFVDVLLDKALICICKVELQDVRTSGFRPKALKRKSVKTTFDQFDKLTLLTLKKHILLGFNVYWQFLPNLTNSMLSNLTNNKINHTFRLTISQLNNKRNVNRKQ
jgi:hypothetical protein